ncbi:MAG: hypothetical protein K2F55_00555 [Erysipelotrichaceae bacterium]|nr:hypothetical protein [Erysipelotrichaceae bacterium]
MRFLKKVSKKKYWQALGVISLTTFALLVTGTFAWQSMNQIAPNKFKGEINHGARLHDDFNGTQNKDIYVENFSDVQTGTPVYARIQLKEYMEIGPDAGNFESIENPEAKDGETSSRNVQVIGENAQYQNVSTWHVHQFQPTTPNDLAFREYWDWEMGEKEEDITANTLERYYMPTFNKRTQGDESLLADVNGTLEGADSNINEGIPYDDYVEWTNVSTKTGTEFYDTEEKADQTHTAKKINYLSRVISMEQWIADGKKAGPYWVYDNDGWAYWAQEILPEETTGLLLNKVNRIKMPDEKYYYEIRAIGQFATAGDWAGFESEENGGISESGKELLNTVAKQMPKVVYMTSSLQAKELLVVEGTSLELQVNVNVQNGTTDVNDPKYKKEREVVWSMADEADQDFNYTIKGNVFTPVQEMVKKGKFTLKATSKLTPSMYTTINVTVLERGIDKEKVEEGEDGKLYIHILDKVYQRVESDGSLSELIYVGVDGKIGTSDDETNIYDMVAEVGYVDPTFGRFYIKLGENRYHCIRTNEVVVSLDHQWPKNISNRLVTEVKVMGADGTTGQVEAKVGQTKQLLAEVYLTGQKIANQRVEWSLSGNTDPNTKIENGVLYVGENEKIGKAISVIATSEEGKANKEGEESKQAVGYINVLIEPLGYEDIASVEEGSETRIRIGDLDYFVLAKEEGKALLMTAKAIEKNGSVGIPPHNTRDGNFKWKDLNIREYLNGEWLEAQPDILKNNIQTTTLYTRHQAGRKNSPSYKATWTEEVYETEDKVFLLSHEDVFGAGTPGYDEVKGSTDTRYYTAHRQLKIPTLGEPGINTTNGVYSAFLRTSLYFDGFYSTPAKASALYYSTAATANTWINSAFYIYPTFWIALPGNTAETPPATDGVNP